MNGDERRNLGEAAHFEDAHEVLVGNVLDVAIEVEVLANLLPRAGPPCIERNALRMRRRRRALAHEVGRVDAGELVVEGGGEGVEGVKRSLDVLRWVDSREVGALGVPVLREELGPRSLDVLLLPRLVLQVGDDGPEADDIVVRAATERRDRPERRLEVVVVEAILLRRCWEMVVGRARANFHR